MTDFAILAGDDDPYHVRQLSLDELDKAKRGLHADLILYPAGTAAAADTGAYRRDRRRARQACRERERRVKIAWHKLTPPGSSVRPGWLKRAAR